MNSTIQPLDIVALTEELPEKGLARGQVGTVVETLAPDVFEVEFSDNDGRTYAMQVLRRSTSGLTLSPGRHGVNPHRRGRIRDRDGGVKAPTTPHLPHRLARGRR